MSSFIVQWIHALVSLLLVPAAIGLFGCVALACIDLGMLFGERDLLRQPEQPADIGVIERRAQQRIERAEILTRTSPMLGLMVTLILLGPGLAALSNGHWDLLAGAMLTAVDATALGLAAGVVGFIVARLRRRWYQEALLRWQRQSPASH